MSTSAMNIGVTWGGTGWHITPIVSLLRYAYEHSNVHKKCNHIYRFGEKDSFEEEACHDLKKTIQPLTFVSVKAGKLRRYRTVQSTRLNIRDIFRLGAGFFQALAKLQQYKIDVLFCKGGYVTVPVALAARALRIPVLVHESDRVPGLTNRVVARFARRSFSGFPHVLPNATVVGQLLSPDFVSETAPSITLKFADRPKTQVLVICGSQGSTAVFSALLRVLDTQWQTVKDMVFYVILGKRNMSFKKHFQRFGNLQIFDFLSSSDLSLLYKTCDIAITRGSATTLEELDLFGIKKLIIPLPYTGGNHQEANAKRYQRHKGDIFLRQKASLPEKLAKELDGLHWFKKEPTLPTATDFFKPHATIREAMLKEAVSK